MKPYVSLKEPPGKRRELCTGGQERHLPEAAVMIAFAIHLFEKGAAAVEIHPDGEHAKQYDIRECLESRGFARISSRGTTEYGGVYSSGQKQLTVRPTPGLGDVTATIKGESVVAECKGGITNSRHAGVSARLRRGLCEAVGLLMARPIKPELLVAVVPATDVTRKLAQKMLKRTVAAGIRIALVHENGVMQFLSPPPHA